MPTVSLCMVVSCSEEEEKFLHQCLMNVKDAADEIIVVVDKGKTSEAAKGMGAKIVEHEWSDDFSVARNESLRHATKEWILVLDADEVLTYDDLVRLKETADENKDAVAFTLNQINYTNDANQMRFVRASNLFTEKFGFAGYFVVPAIRFFKNNMGFSFRRRVHELIDESIIEKGLEDGVRESGIPIHHLKMLKGNLLESEKRYVELSEKETADNPKNYKAHYDIGIISIFSTKDFEKAEMHLKKSMEIEPGFNEARIALGYLYFLTKRHESALKTFEEALQHDSKSPQLQANTGSCLFMLGRHKEAADSYKKAIELGHPDAAGLREKIRQIEMFY